LKFLWEAWEIILRHNILFFICVDSFSFIIVKLASTWFSHNFSWIIEKDACTEIWQKISESILRRIIYPLCDPYLCCLVDVSSTFDIWCSWTSILSIIRFFDRIVGECSSSRTFLSDLNRVLFTSFALRIRSDWNWSHLIVNLWHLVWSRVRFVSFS